MRVVRPCALLLALALVTIASSAGPSTANPIDFTTGRQVPCTPGVGGCMPTVVECALGGYNGHWDGGYPGRITDCTGGLGHISHYAGGYAGNDQKHSICGAVINGDAVETASTLDPNLCPPASAAPGFGVRGRAFSPGVITTGGVVASVSPAAARAGADVLDRGGNAVDAAAATVFAVGVTRPEMCGIGGAGEFVYRSRSGKTATLEYEPAAPASVTPDLYQGQGVWQYESGHRVVGVPGTVAGMSQALKRYGTISLAQAIAPAERLARNGFPVSPGLAVSYGVGITYVPAGALAGANHLRQYPASAQAYLRAGGLAYPPDNPAARSILKLPDMAHSLRLIAKYGPDAFYRDTTYPEGPSIGHLILADMRNAAQHPMYPGDDPSPWKASDLANYRAHWRTPTTTTYRGFKVISAAVPTVGGVDTIETLNILEGFGLGSSIRHSSADYVHLFAEAQKLAWADTAYLADPAFHKNPTRVLLSKAYAAQRRRQIDLHKARDYGPGRIPGMARPSSREGASASGHTTHVSVIDRMGNAVSVTCTVGAEWGSGVTPPGAGFLLNSLLVFNAPGTIDEARGGKRPLTTTTPTIVEKAGRAALVTGGAGGAEIPGPVALTVSDRVDYGMDPARALDAARVISFCASDCRGLETKPPPGGTLLEDGRVRQKEIDDLTARGQPLVFLGEYVSPFPNVQAVGTDFATGLRVGASDPREDRGVTASSLPGPVGCVDEIRPVSVFSARRKMRLTHLQIDVSGRSSDRSCGGKSGSVRRVDVAVTKAAGRGRCRFLHPDGRLGTSVSCERASSYLRATGASRWRYRNEVDLPRGHYVIRVRAIDRVGNVESQPTVDGNGPNLIRFTLRRKQTEEDPELR